MAGQGGQGYYVGLRGPPGTGQDVEIVRGLAAPEGDRDAGQCAAQRPDDQLLAAGCCTGEVTDAVTEMSVPGLPDSEVRTA